MHIKANLLLKVTAIIIKKDAVITAPYIILILNVKVEKEPMKNAKA